MEAAGNLLMLPADARLNLASCDPLTVVHLLRDDVDNGSAQTPNRGSPLLWV